jgi:1,4-dihydroxy-2-naphthoate octaprenyltransferase
MVIPENIRKSELAANDKTHKERLIVRIGKKIAGILILTFFVALALIIISTLKLSSYHPG